VVVSDSIYTFRAVRRAGLPLAAINNADMVARGIARYRDWPAAVLPQFLCVELGDYLYHRLIPELIISPRLDPADTAATAPYQAVGPIVRKEFRPMAENSGQPERVVIMLSGSAFGSPVRLPRRCVGAGNGPRIDVVGRPAPPDGIAPPGVSYHGKLRDCCALLSEADLLVVNGGCSAVSEALVLRKPSVVLPVPRHAEQWVNSRIVRSLGVGMSATELELEDAIDAALSDIDRLRSGFDAIPPFADGAAQAAGLIIALARRAGR
jgi:UDP-N-acetylglucosamine:LPS N-acetylglucosamine transferase